MADPPDGAGVFPCQEGSRIDFEWGLGRGLLLAEASSSGAPTDTDNGFGAAQWYGKIQLATTAAVYLHQNGDTGTSLRQHSGS